MKKIDDNPFSFESYLLRDAQRITAEICERREHKISNSAVMSVQRIYKLFKESEPDSINTPKIPRNSTPEEEKLFQALVDSLINYREKMRSPLIFPNSDMKNKGSDIPVDNPLNSGIVDGVNNLKNKPRTDMELDPIKENGDEGFTLEEDSLVEDNGKNKGFTPEEEAAIEDDIYKQFGKEPFPGNNLEKDSKIKTSGDPETVNSELSKNSANEEINNQNIQTDVLLVLDELPSIMGVDKKVYGPFLPQDIITIPEPNARIIIKNQKGKSIQKYK